MILRKQISKTVLKYKPWQLVSIFGRTPFITPLLQKVYYSYFSGPKSVKIHITNKCNYRCVYCYSDRYNEKSLSTKEWISFIDALNQYEIQTVEISGGEPFLEKGLFDILRKCAENNYQVTIYTNGSLITKEIISKLKSFHNQIIISIKYDSQQNYIDKTRSSKDLDRIESNIKLLVKNNLPVVAFITVTKDNVKSIKQIINKSIDLGAFPVVERYAEVKDTKINKLLSISSKEWNEITKIIMHVYSEYKLLIDGVNRVQGGTCSCFKTQVSIMQKGEVLPCQFLPLSMSVGNIKNEKFNDIWNRIEIKRKEWNKLPKECESCKSKFVCGGGCKVDRYLKDKESNTKDELCSSDLPTTYGHCAFSVIHNLDKNNMKNIKLKKAI